MKIAINGEILEVSGGCGSGGGVPKGTIVIWSGAATAIPSGWALCDGQNGTPDLRDRFVVGAGTSYEVGATGGEAEHKLTIAELALHSHVLPATGSDAAKPVSYGAGHAGYGVLNSEPTTNPVGNNQPHNNLPPYYALCYIMKITDGGSGTGSGGSSEEIYSTEETRIGTWIDGKPLYRRVLTLTKSTVENLPVYELSTWSVDSVCRVDGYIYRVTGENTSIANQLFMGKEYVVSSGTTRGLFTAVVVGRRDTGTDTRALKLLLNGLSTNYEAEFVFILEYTKTTD